MILVMCHCDQRHIISLLHYVLIRLIIVLPFTSHLETFCINTFLLNQQGLIGGVLGSAIRSGSELVTDIAKETSRELDRYATSPLLVSYFVMHWHVGFVVQMVHFIARNEIMQRLESKLLSNR